MPDTPPPEKRPTKRKRKPAKRATSATTVGTRASKPVTRSVGAFLRTTREARHLTLDELASLVGASGADSQEIDAIENGTQLPGLELLTSLSRVLHFDPVEVLERVEITKSAPIVLTNVSLEEMDRRAQQRFWAGDFESALSIFDSMLSRLVLEPPADGIAAARLHARIEISQAATLRRFGALRAARTTAEHAILVSEEFPDLQARAYIVLAAIHAHVGHAPLARVAASQAVELSEKANIEVQAMAWMEHALTLYRFKDHENAYEAFRTARKLSIQARDLQNLVLVEGNTGLCLMEMGRAKEARTRLTIAIQLARSQKAPLLEASWLVSLGRLNLDEDRPEEAERLGELAVLIAEPRRHWLTVFRAEWLRHLAKCRRDPSAADGPLRERLRRLLPRVSSQRGVTEIREFRAEEGFARLNETG